MLTLCTRKSGWYPRVMQIKCLLSELQYKLYFVIYIYASSNLGDYNSSKSAICLIGLNKSSVSCPPYSQGNNFIKRNGFNLLLELRFFVQYDMIFQGYKKPNKLETSKDSTTCTDFQLPLVVIFGIL